MQSFLRIINPIETQRLFLRELTIEDAENFYNLNLDPEVVKYTGDKAFENIESAKTFLAGYDQYKKYGFGRWAVIHKTSGEFFGWCGLKHSADLKETDLGFRFFKKHWNQGYATEAARASIDLGFQRFGLDVIIGRARIENEASVRTLQKCGMIFDRHFDFSEEKGVIYKIEKKQIMTANSTIAPDFEIKNTGPFSKAFIKREIFSFQQAADFIMHLPYKRNKNKNDLLTVFTEGCGTCGSKHALLKKLAEENNFNELKLMLGIFKMQAYNTPEVNETLKSNSLDYIPEGHNYLRFRGQLLDYTKPDFKLSKDVRDLLEEAEFDPDNIGEHKVVVLKQYHKKWLDKNKDLKISAEELWKVREQCIADLQ